MKPGSKSLFFELPPYLSSGFTSMATEMAVFFACTSQQSVLDGTNGLSSSKSCIVGLCGQN